MKKTDFLNRVLPLFCVLSFLTFNVLSSSLRHKNTVQMDPVIAEIRSIATSMGETSAALTRTSGEIATKLAELAAAEQGQTTAAPSPALPVKIAALRESRTASWKDHLATTGGFTQEDVEELLMKREWEGALIPKTVAPPPAVKKTSVSASSKVSAVSEEELSLRIAEVAAKLRDEYSKKTKEAYEKGRSEAKQEYKKELAAYHQQVVQQLKKS